MMSRVPIRSPSDTPKLAKQCVTPLRGSANAAWRLYHQSIKHEVPDAEIGFDWVCFHQVSDYVYFHKSFVKNYLHSFGYKGNWVCFA